MPALSSRESEEQLARLQAMVDLEQSGHASFNSKSENFSCDPMAAMMAHHSRYRRPTSQLFPGPAGSYHKKEEEKQEEVPLFGNDSAGDISISMASLFDEDDSSKDDNDMEPSLISEENKREKGKEKRGSLTPTRAQLSSNKMNSSARMQLSTPQLPTVEKDHSRRRRGSNLTGMGFNNSSKQQKKSRRASMNNSAYHQSANQLERNLEDVEEFLKLLQQKDPEVRQRFLVNTLERQTGMSEASKHMMASHNNLNSSSGRKLKDMNDSFSITGSARSLTSSQKHKKKSSKRRKSGMSASTSAIHTSSRRSSDIALQASSGHGSRRRSIDPTVALPPTTRGSFALGSQTKQQATLAPHPNMKGGPSLAPHPKMKTSLTPYEVSHLIKFGKPNQNDALKRYSTDPTAPLGRDAGLDSSISTRGSTRSLTSSLKHKKKGKSSRRKSGMSVSESAVQTSSRRSSDIALKASSGHGSRPSRRRSSGFDPKVAPPTTRRPSALGYLSATLTPPRRAKQQASLAPHPNMKGGASLAPHPKMKGSPAKDPLSHTLAVLEQMDRQSQKDSLVRYSTAPAAPLLHDYEFSDNQLDDSLNASSDHVGGRWDGGGPNSLLDEILPMPTLSEQKSAHYPIVQRRRSSSVGSKNRGSSSNSSIPALAPMGHHPNNNTEDDNRPHHASTTSTMMPLPTLEEQKPKRSKSRTRNFLRKVRRSTGDPSKIALPDPQDYFEKKEKKRLDREARSSSLSPARRSRSSRKRDKKDKKRSSSLSPVPNQPLQQTLPTNGSSSTRHSSSRRKMEDNSNSHSQSSSMMDHSAPYHRSNTTGQIEKKKESSSQRMRSKSQNHHSTRRARSPHTSTSSSKPKKHRRRKSITAWMGF